jgi:hypothetical protein
MSIKNALKELLDNLDKVDEKYPEVTDTAVREMLHDAVRIYFVYGSPDGEYPTDNDFAMFTKRGNQAVHKAIVRFLTHPDVKAARVELATSEARLDAFQDDEVESSNGSHYDWYFGWLPSLPSE